MNQQLLERRVVFARRDSDPASAGSCGDWRWIHGAPTRSFVRRVCLATVIGMGMAPSTFAQTQLTWPEVRAKFEMVNPTLQADQLGVDHQQAWRLLKREGVPLRPRWYRSVFCFPDGSPRDMEDFSARLRQLRHNRGWSQEALGRLCHLSKTAIGYWERGQEGPSWKTARRLAGALGVTLEDLGIAWDPIA